MTAVIVRSSAKRPGGARTKASAVLRGARLLAFTVDLSRVVSLIPLPALAALPVHVHVRGKATFLRLPQILRGLDEVSLGGQPMPFGAVDHPVPRSASAKRS
ncbi:hypothetical protein [Amycolatopsis thermoflava]|uniref:hypothetical protein n=1 Tax=Amycolatopsis thermoflava TaxID=84480 RepID=UPI003806EE13